MLATWARDAVEWREANRSDMYFEFGQKFIQWQAFIKHMLWERPWKGTKMNKTWSLHSKCLQNNREETNM